MGAIASVLATNLGITNTTFTTVNATTGVNMTLAPDRVYPNGVARWVDRSGGVPAGYPVFTMGVRAPSQGNRNFKVSAAVAIPTLETIGTSSNSGYLPGQKVGYTGVGRAEFVLPERMTSAQRIALFSLFVSLFSTHIRASDTDPTDVSGSPLPNAVLNLESVY